MPIALTKPRPILFLRGDEQEPAVVSGTVGIEQRIGGGLAIMLSEEAGPVEGALDPRGRGPSALGDQRCRDVGPFTRALAQIEPGDDRRIEGRGRRVITDAGYRQG